MVKVSSATYRWEPNGTMCHIHRTQQAVETLQAAELGTWWFVRRRACPDTRLRDARFADAFRVQA